MASEEEKSNLETEKRKLEEEISRLKVRSSLKSKHWILYEFDIAY